jgi:predicted PurR-regulated permease PerM
MGNKAAELRLPVYARLTIILLGFVLLVIGLRAAGPILIPLAFSFLLALLLYPMCKMLERRRVPRGLAIIVAILVMITVLGALLLLVMSQLIGFSGELPEMTARLETAIFGLQDKIETQTGLSPESQISWLTAKVQEFAENSGDLLGSIVQPTLTFLAAVGLIPFYVFFILFYRDHLKEFVFRVTKPDEHENVVVIMKKTQKVIQHYLSGIFTVMVILAVLNTSALLIIGIKHAVFFGVFAAMLTIIPYIGVFIGSSLPIVYSLAMSDTYWTPVLVYLTFTAIQTLEGNVITPNIVGNKVSINPLVAIIALVIGAHVWGIVGMIIFVPFVAMLKVAFDNIESMKPYGLLLGVEKKSFQFLDLCKKINPMQFIPGLNDDKKEETDKTDATTGEPDTKD